MRIVLDTNVLVSGLLTPFGPAAEILRMVSSGELQLCFDTRVLAEYDEVLRREKFQFDETKVAALLEQIRGDGWLVAPGPLPMPLPDPDDEPFLQAAIAGDVESLVTGNRAHFPAKLRGGVRIHSPTEFLRYYRNMQPPA